MKTMFRSHAAQGALALVMAMSAPVAVPAQAQSQPQAQAGPQETTEGRLRRIEAELRAVQRKVFPDGAGKTFGPEIAPSAGTTGPVGAPATTPVTDLLARMDAVEGQLQRLTAQSEESQNRMGKLEARIAALEPPPPPPAPVPAPAPDGAAPAVAPTPGPVTAPVPKPVAVKPAPAKAVEPSADRLAAVQAIEKPSSDDKGEDEYSYGYRLWEAKFFPEAQQQLQRYVQQYPKHKRISYARNLLGRTYLDDGKPGTAAQWFLQNYQADKAGDRAADSLLYLGVAMTKLKETKRACVAFAEFKATYPTEAAGRLKPQYDAASKTVACN